MLRHSESKWRKRVTGNKGPDIQGNQDQLLHRTLLCTHHSWLRKEGEPIMRPSWGVGERLVFVLFFLKYWLYVMFIFYTKVLQYKPVTLLGIH